MIIEYIETSLEDFIGQNLHDVKAINTLYVKLFESILPLHAMGYIHNDIKPSNFLIKVIDSLNYEVYLIDLGLVEEFKTENEHKT